MAFKKAVQIWTDGAGVKWIKKEDCDRMLELVAQDSQKKLNALIELYNEEAPEEADNFERGNLD